MFGVLRTYAGVQFTKLVAPVEPRRVFSEVLLRVTDLFGHVRVPLLASIPSI
jgi:hypothetical protein